MQKFRQYIIDFFNLIFPNLCNACGKQLYHGEQQICTACLYDLPYTDFHLYAENAVAKLFYGRIRCQDAMAMLYFRKGTKVQRLVHQLKYRSKPELGFRLGALLGERLAVKSVANFGSPAPHSLHSQLETASYHPDLIIPVPLHPKKERSRGYNQSRMIADGISGVLHIPVSSTQLIRQRSTGTQTRRNRYDRFQNMQSVFGLADTAEIRGKHVLLVDDVITTGATLEACGQVLIDGGIAKLSIAALAYAE